MPTGTYTRIASALAGTRELVLVVSVEGNKFLQNPEMMPTPGMTKYRECKFLSGGFSNNYGDYVFLQMTNQDDRREYVTLNFGKAKTTAEARVPVKTYTVTEPYYWPSVLVHWDAKPDPINMLETRLPGGGTGQTRRWKVRYVLQPYAQGQCAVQVREYLGPAPFKLRKPFIVQPTEVNWDLPGDSGSLARVLVPHRFPVPVNVIDNTATAHRPVAPTNLGGWAPHLINDDQTQLSSGLWHRITKTVQPPESIPPLTIR